MSVVDDGVNAEILAALKAETVDLVTLARAIEKLMGPGPEPQEPTGDLVRIERTIAGLGRLRTFLADVEKRDKTETLELRMAGEQAREDAAKLAESLRALARLLRGGDTVTTGTGGNSTDATAKGGLGGSDLPSEPAHREPGEDAP